MNKPCFSVIMPVYNAAENLAATIRSVLLQTERCFELIFVDDGSTDNSLAIMMSFASEDDRIKLVSQVNRGVSAARNLGIELARGDLVAFIDADDLWAINKLEIHKNFHARQKDLDASYAQIAFMDEKGTDGRRAKTYSTVRPGALSIDEIIAENPTCTMSNLVVTRRAIDAVGGFHKDMSYAEDQEWLARLVSEGYLVAGIDHYLVDYRLNQSGLSVDLHAMYSGWQQLATQYGDAESLHSANAVYCRYLSRRALRAGAPASVALEYAIQGIRSDRSAFLQDPKRGWLTLISAFAALSLPRAQRVQLFA